MNFLALSPIQFRLHAFEDILTLIFFSMQRLLSEVEAAHSSIH